MRILFLPALLILAACAQPPLEVPARLSPEMQNLPPMKRFSQPPARRSLGVSNAQVLRDFLELSFEMESGKKLDRMTRFEGPVTIALAQPGPQTLQRDLSALIDRLRQEARIDIRQVDTGSPANIVIERLPRTELQRAVPHAACFVVPRVNNWAEFRRNRRSNALDWTTLERRTRATVFIPEDVSPQETRDCLHEEVAQALGPLNDIYRLPNSIFNDDNFHTVLTGFDMLILRAYYHPEMRNGMTPAEAARTLAPLLARLNPSGENIRDLPPTPTPRAWKQAIEKALGPRASMSRRLAEAQRALEIASVEGWTDNRMGFSLYALGRLSLGTRADTSAQAFARALAVYSRAYGPDGIHAATVSMQLAAFALAGGQTDTAITLVNRAIPPVTRAQNAALLSTLLLIKAEALDAQGKRAEARVVRLDSLGWARYGFGSDQAVRDRAGEIAQLLPPSARIEG